MPNEFFEEMTEASEVKATIVSQYFAVWATIMNKKAKSNKLAYIDLYAGPGRYKDGSKSTPLKILEYIISNPDLAKKVVTIFNDANLDYANNLSEEIKKLENIGSLKYPPNVSNSAIDDKAASLFSSVNLIPTFAFIDPWGYKGLSSDLIHSLIKDWGSDCVFYFNYNRINMGLNNPSVQSHINSLFGSERSDKMRKELINKSPIEREEYILNELAEALSIQNKNYVLPFRFMKKAHRTSHYLILVTKHMRGYTLMKEIMYNNSSRYEDNVASFSYIPVINKQLSILSLYDRPLDNLGQELLTKFAGKTKTVKEIYEEHQYKTPFILRNYKEALLRLEGNGEIICTSTKKRRPKNTMGDDIKVSFPAN